MKVNVIFEDDSMMVLDKPAGLVVDASETQKGEVLADILQRDYGLPAGGLDRAGIVHRLDKDTSGLLLVAKTKPALDNLQAQFKQRKVKKEYLALVHGLIEEGGKVSGAVGRNPKVHNKFGIFEDIEGRESETEYESIEKFKVQSSKFKVVFPDFSNAQILKLERMNYGLFTMVKVKPLTGRTHQIRVHLKYIGHPIVGDEKYVGRKMHRLDKRWCPRQFLHAKKIGFYHPISGKWMELKSQLPEDLRKALWKISLYNWQ